MKRALRIALAALVLLAVAVVLVAGTFVSGIDLDGDFLRAPLERALTAAFDVPTRIEGPLRLRTGRTATVSADALVLADPLGPPGATLARGIAPRASVDLLALLRRSVRLDEVSGERLDVALRRRADGRANWTQLFSSSDGTSPVSFAGIERLRIGRVVGSYQREGEPPVPFAIGAFDGALPLHDPIRASGTAQFAGQEVGFDLRTASLAALTSAAAAVPLQGTVKWSGVQAALDGTLGSGARLEATFDASAADAAAPLAALGIAAREPGPLALRARLTATATQASARELVLSLGRSKATGSADLAWGGPRPTATVDLAAEHVDAAPFLGGESPSTGTGTTEQWVARLERLATGGEASVKLGVDEVAGLPVTVSKLGVELRSGGAALATKLAAVLAGTPIEATLDFDARQPLRTLAARLDSGAASTASLPRAARPADLAASASSLRGHLRGSGADAAAIVASLQGDFDARNLRWTFGGPSPIAGQFDVARLVLRGTTASSAEVSGRIEGAACSLRVSGGAAAPLLAGEPWPMQLSANCPHERVSAKGSIAVGGQRPTADVTFEVAGDRSGPVARAAGLPSFVPYPIAARGSLLLDARQARLRLASIRVGRSAGTGEITVPRGDAGTARLRLALSTLSLDEIAASRATADTVAEPLDRTLLRADQRLPEVDFDLAAERIEFGDARLGDFKLSGALRARGMPAAPFELDWEGIALRGQVGLDLGARPRLSFEGSARDADLRPLLDRLGADAVRVRAGQLSLSARAEGERLRDLLASASLQAAAARAQVELPRPLLPGGTGRGQLEATFSAAPGQPSKLTVHGQVEGQAAELTADGPPIDALSRDGTSLPLALRLLIGDIRLDADGRFARDGSGDARVRLAGGRLDYLGRLIGLGLPAVAPYAASAAIALAPGSAEFSALKASFGDSRLAGRLHLDRREGRRAALSATVRVPVLHLEDIGAGQWLGERAEADPPRADPAARRAQQAIERLLDLLPRADVEASIDIDALRGGGQHFASGRLLASLRAGALDARLLDVQAQDGITNAELHIDAGASPPRFSLRADVRDVEYGALARAMHPASQVNGRLDVVASLSAQSPPAGLLQALQGTADFAVYPRDMRADALRLWGTGLLSAILGAVERDTQAAVLCTVAGFAVADGVARSDGFFVETTSVRIVGDLEVRLDNGALAGQVDPRSNSPQLFAISPRMVIGGAVGSPTLSAARENVVLVPLRFASPLALFSRDWLGRGSQRGGGEADCREAFERVLEAHHRRTGGG